MLVIIAYALDDTKARQAASLREYLLVRQDAVQVEVYRRANGWLPEYAQSGEIHLDCLDIGVPVDAIYADVETA